MAFSIHISTLMLLYLATFAGLSNGVFISGVTDARWNGIVAYFSVPRARIAAKLAEIQSSSSSCDAGKKAVLSFYYVNKLNQLKNCHLLTSTLLKNLPAEGKIYCSRKRINLKELNNI